MVTGLGGGWGGGLGLGHKHACQYSHEEVRTRGHTSIIYAFSYFFIVPLL